MAVNIGINLAGDARGAAQAFISQLNAAASSVTHLSDSIQLFNKDGKLISETVKVLTKDGEKLDVVLKKNGQNYELIGVKADNATASLKRFEAQQKAIAAAKRRDDAGVAVNQAAQLPGAIANTPAQAAAVEAAFGRIRSAIESGTISLGRFQTILAQIKNDPKAIIPNLNAQEAQLAATLRNLQTGFQTSGDKAQELGTKLNRLGLFIARIFGSQVIGRITGFLSSSLNEGFKTAEQFSIKIAEIETISQSAGVATNEWAEGLRDISREFGNSQLDVAESAYQAISNQVVQGAQTFEFLSSSAKFARASVSSLADAVNLGSSALKSYNLTAADADKVYASFFKTIELGRIRAGDLANTFGRVAPTAAQVGVSLDEVNAVLATITSKGVLPNEAMTLLNNILLKLIRPTDEMKSLLAEWGVASGSAAIATFGFTGVLNKLNQESEKGGTRLGDLFNQIRAVRSAFALTGGSFGDFTANFQQIQQAKGTYDRAAEIIAQSFGQRFKVELNKIAVFFTEEFGDQVIKGTVQISDYFGGLANTVKILTSTILNITKAAATYYIALNVGRGAIIGYTAASTVMNSTMLGGIATTKAAQAATESLNTALGSLQGFAAVFSLSFMIGQFLELDKIFESNEAKARRLKNQYEQLSKRTNIIFTGREGKDLENQRLNDLITETRNNFNNRYQLALTYYSNQLKLSTNLKNRATQDLKDVTEQTKIASKSYFDVLSKNLSEFRRQANDARQIYENSLKSLEGLERKTSDAIFNKRLGFASEGNIDDFTGFVVNDQKIGLIKKRISELEESARLKFREGTKESVEDARRIYDEVRQQQAALLDAQVSKQKREFEEAVKRGTVTPTSTSIDPITGQIKQRFDFVVRTADFERQIQATKNEQIAAERRLQTIQQERLAAIEKEELAEKEKLRVVQQAFTAIQQINVLDKEGKVKDQYRGTKITLPGEKPIEIPGAIKALEEFDIQAARIREQSSKESIATQAQVEQTLAQQRIALERQVQAVITNERITAESQRVEVAKKSTQDQITFVQDKFREGNAIITTGIKSLFTEINKIRDFDAGGRDEAIGTSSPRAALRRFSNDSSAENFVKLNEEFNQFKNNYDAWLKRQGNQEGLAGLTGEALQRFQTLQRAFETIQQGVTTRDLAGGSQLDALQQAGEKLANSVINIPNSIRLIEEAAGTSAPIAKQNIETITSATVDLINNLNTAATVMRRLNQQLPELRKGVIGQAPGGNFGGPVKYLNSGGLVGFNPRGSDTVPAMLNPREFIMTEQATQKFEPLLRAMNSRAGITTNNSEANITNIGDVNVNVSGTPTSSKTIRDMGKQLRRDLRRGALKLK